MAPYLGVFIISLFALGAVSAFLVLTTILGPKRPSSAKSEPFECGEPAKIKGGGVSIHFYVIAMLFIVFDVELIFLFPWAVLFRTLGFAGLVEMAVFVFFLVLGYLYALKKGALEAG